MRIVAVLLAFLFADACYAQLTMKTAEDALRRLRQAEDAIDAQGNDLCNFVARLESLENRLKQLESVKPQPTPSKPNFPERLGPPEEEDVETPKITCYTRRSGCEWCDKVKADGLKAIYEKAGWKWEDKETGEGMVPRFVVCVKGRCYSRDGYFPGDGAARKRAFHDWMKQILRMDFTGTKPKTPWTYDQPDNYASRWTYPGDIREHLAGEPHYAGSIGLTKEQCEELHDRMHDALAGN